MKRDDLINDLLWLGAFTSGEDEEGRKKAIKKANDLFDKYEPKVKNNGVLPVVINWVAIIEPKHPEINTEILVKFKDESVGGRFFNDDMRFYNTEHDFDITDMITHWAAMPK